MVHAPRRLGKRTGTPIGVLLAVFLFCGSTGVAKEDAPITVRGRQYQNTLNELNAKIAKNPRDVEALHARAKWYFDNLEFSLCIKDETEALKTKETVVSLDTRAEANRQLGRYDECLKDLTRVIKIHPVAKAYHNRSLCYKALNEIDNAISDSNFAVKLDPVYPGNYEDRAVLFRMKKDYASAIKDMKQAIAISSPGVNRCTYLGDLQMEARDFKGARASYDMALKADPRLLKTIYSKAKACEALGLKVEADSLKRQAKQIESEEIGKFNY